MDGSFLMRHPYKFWICGSRVMMFFRFQLHFGHAVTHSECSRTCPACPLQEGLVGGGLGMFKEGKGLSEWAPSH
jgi:hypothetical protein